MLREPSRNPANPPAGTQAEQELAQGNCGCQSSLRCFNTEWWRVDGFNGNTGNFCAGVEHLSLRIMEAGRAVVVQAEILVSSAHCAVSRNSSLRTSVLWELVFS